MDEDLFGRGEIWWCECEDEDEGGGFGCSNEIVGNVSQLGRPELRGEFGEAPKAEFAVTVHSCLAGT